MNETGLSEKELENIRSIFQKYQKVDRVLLYGSRAMGNYKPTSDIDITLIGNEIDSSLLTKIEFDLDDLMFPYKFDVSIHNKITNPEFLGHINRIGREIYKKRQK